MGIRAIKPRKAKAAKEQLMVSKVVKVMERERLLYDLIEGGKLTDQELSDVGEFKRVYETIIGMGYNGFTGKAYKEYQNLREGIISKYTKEII